LAAGECAEQLLCAPRRWLEDLDAVPTACRAPGNLEGRCLPACLPQVQRVSAQLERDVCANGELCLPCYDPLTSSDTGACRIASDAPVEPAQPYAGCCAVAGVSLGICLPWQALTIGEASALPTDSCGGPDVRCFPRESVLEPHRLAACDATLPIGAIEPGLCIAQCFLPFGIGGARGSCAEAHTCLACSMFPTPQPGCP
jgi:hypothetical protein